MTDTDPFALKLRTPGERKAYRDGLRAGFRQYAWQKDGVHYVGTYGKTLAQALAWVEQCAEADLEGQRKRGEVRVQL